MIDTAPFAAYIAAMQAVAQQGDARGESFYSATEADALTMT